MPTARKTRPQGRSRVRELSTREKARLRQLDVEGKKYILRALEEDGRAAYASGRASLESGTSAPPADRVIEGLDFSVGGLDTVFAAFGDLRPILYVSPGDLGIALVCVHNWFGGWIKIVVDYRLGEDN